MSDVDDRKVSLPNKDPYSPQQCAWAMGQLLQRLVDEGYVRDERAPELLDRAANLERYRGFLTTAELKSEAPTLDPTPEEELLS